MPTAKLRPFMASIPPLVNAARKPGVWQRCDILFHEARFDGNGNVARPANVTVFYNGVLVQGHVEMTGRPSIPNFVGSQGDSPRIDVMMRLNVRGPDSSIVNGMERLLSFSPDRHLLADDLFLLLV
jgi:hypothetical protein